MKTTRLGLTITFTPPNPESINDAHEPDDMLVHLQEAMQDPAQANFKVWHQMAGHIEEDGEPTQDTIDACDKAINFQMNADTAKAILTHPQTLQAMLLTFGQIIASQPKGGQPQEGQPQEGQPVEEPSENELEGHPEIDPDEEDPGLAGEGGELIN